MSPAAVVSSNASSNNSNDDDDATVASSTVTTSNNNTKSSQEEIDRQHNEAVEIVKQGIQFKESSWEGEIPLSYKQRPVEDILLEIEKESFPRWSTRGYADVTALQNILKNGYNQKYNLTKKYKPNTKGTSCTYSNNMNYWSPEIAATYNVAIHRPSHDAWGIPKIVLLFCDDFVQDLYELPFWYEKQSPFRTAIQPILDNVLRIPTERVVRMLLASLPPNTTIPIHHDSGEWVKYTHRVHVPILVNDINKILFRCGTSIDTMEAIKCTPGHVFEINNQGKHAVSNCDDDYRVHLILDYVDEDFINKKHNNNNNNNNKQRRIRLQPGETLLQTRRSIDRGIDKGMRPTPTFIILGSQKAGTTYLYELLMQHPLLIKPKKFRETHCLDWRWNDNLKTIKERQNWCYQFYYYNELQLHPSCITGDSTPSYLIDSKHVIPRLKEVFPHLNKFFIMCRNPINRAESHYAMVTSKIGTDAQLKSRGNEWRCKSFNQVIIDDILKMHSCGLIPYWKNINSLKNIDDDDDNPWKNLIFDEEIYNNFSGTINEDIAWDKYMDKYILQKTGSYGLLTRGLYELNIRPWLRVYNRSNFIILKLEALQDTINNNNEILFNEIWDFLDVPHVDISILDTTPKNTREYDTIITNETKIFLQKFFQPHNNKLIQLLNNNEHYDITGIQKIHWLKGW